MDRNSHRKIYPLDSLTLLDDLLSDRNKRPDQSRSKDVEKDDDHPVSSSNHLFHVPQPSSFSSKEHKFASFPRSSSERSKEAKPKDQIDRRKGRKSHQKKINLREEVETDTDQEEEHEERRSMKKGSFPPPKGRHQDGHGSSDGCVLSPFFLLHSSRRAKVGKVDSDHDDGYNAEGSKKGKLDFHFFISFPLNFISLLFYLV